MKPKTMNNFVTALEQLIEIQGANGNWDHDPYMHGMYNGLICALAVAETDDAVCTTDRYRDAPEQWVRDIIEEEKAEDLRNKFPALKTAYEEYKAIERLVNG